MSCRFELRVKGVDEFKCAIRFGFDGWAYIWSHKKGIRDICRGCEFSTPGRPLLLDKHVPVADWGDIAGKRIRAKDWIDLEKRGYEMTRSGPRKVAE